MRQRLEALNRERLPAKLRPPEVPQRPNSQGSKNAAEPRSVVGGKTFDSEPLVVENELGSHLCYSVPVEQLWPGGPKLVSGRLEHLAAQKIEGDCGALIQALPDRAVMLDLETCGLSGAALFLVGLLRWIDQTPTVELLFARHYGEEAAVLASLWERLASADVLATFNGKSFDWPMVLDRSRRHLLHKRFELCEPVHLDVLHHARRKWKQALPDCRLQTIERMVCRRARGADIPGAQIPAAYDAFVRTRRDDEMRLVLHHNALDLVTLLDIAMRVAG